MLRQLRALVRKAAPDATEKLSYGMPYYGYRGRLAYFAAFPGHVSFFSMGSAKLRRRFAAAVAPYRRGKATLRFPLGSRIPSALLTRLVKARAAENGRPPAR